MYENNELRTISRLCKSEFGFATTKINQVILIELTNKILERRITGFDTPSEKYKYHLIIYVSDTKTEYIECQKETYDSKSVGYYYRSGKKHKVYSFWLQ